MSIHCTVIGSSTKTQRFHSFGKMIMYKIKKGQLPVNIKKTKKKNVFKSTEMDYSIYVIPLQEFTLNLFSKHNDGLIA
jgi:flagellar basal body-associated protein FliL